MVANKSKHMHSSRKKSLCLLGADYVEALHHLMIRASRIRRYLPGKHSLNTKVPLQVSGQKKTPSQCKVAFVKHTLHHIYVPAAKKNIYSSRYELGCSKKHNVSGQARHLCGSIANSPPQPKKQRTDHSRDDINLKLYHPGYRLGSWQP